MTTHHFWVPLLHSNIPLQPQMCRCNKFCMYTLLGSSFSTVHKKEDKWNNSSDLDNYFMIEYVAITYVQLTERVCIYIFTTCWSFHFTWYMCFCTHSAFITNLADAAAPFAATFRTWVQKITDKTRDIRHASHTLFIVVDKFSHNNHFIIILT